MEKPLITLMGITLTTAVFEIAPASITAKDCAAVAEVKKPAKVTPICIVDRNELELSVSFFICFAFLLPDSAIFSILLSFNEITAISDIAKNALTKINANRITIFRIILPGSVSIEQNLSLI